MFKFRLTGTVALLASLAAASQAGTITRDDVFPFYGPNLVNYVAGQGSFPAVIINNPFPDDADGSALSSELHLPGFFAQAPVTAVASAVRKDGHLVLVFDPATNYPGSRAICADPDQFATARRDATLRLQAVFCYNQDPVSEAYLETPRPQGPHDAGFRQSLGQLMNVLLPSRTPDGEQCQTAPNC